MSNEKKGASVAMTEMDFIRISEMIPDAIIDLKYMTHDNFIGQKIYDRSYDQLRLGTLKKLKSVSDILKEHNYRIVIWDAYRPLHVQQVFWEAMPDERYVAPPTRGSKHNRGCAVDITLATMDGQYCLMPTSYDDFSTSARADNMQLESDILKRLQLLQESMKAEGFELEMEEWWHFNDVEWMKYPVE